MYDHFWHQTLVSLAIISVVMGITFLASNAAQKRQYTRRAYDTYVLGDGIVNSITITLDVKFSDVKRRRILSEYGKVLATYAPDFDPNSASSAEPVR